MVGFFDSNIIDDIRFFRSSSIEAHNIAASSSTDEKFSIEGYGFFDHGTEFEEMDVAVRTEDDTRTVNGNIREGSTGHSIDFATGR